MIDLRLLLPLASAALVMMIGTVAAAPLGTGAFVPRMPLACRIGPSGKTIVITNSTAGTLSAGTKIGYDAVRIPDGQHYGKTVGGPQLAPGASFQMGGQQSSSCTAWYVRPLLLQRTP